MKKEQDTIKYFVYRRKSSDDSRQVASLSTQKSELEILAKRSDAKIVGEFEESKTAKKPGREQFNRMLNEIEAGKANGIICWKLDRLARNPVDEGRVRWLLQQGIIHVIKTYERDFYPEDHSLIASVEMSMATQYSRDLRTMAFRTIRDKLRKHSRPGLAPVGYLNDISKPQGFRDYIEDPERLPLIKKLLQHMLTGNYSVLQLYELMRDDWGFRTRVTSRQGGKPISISGIYRILTEPYYYGYFWYKDPDTGERKLWKHDNTPIITEAEFDKIQVLLGRKGRPRPKTRAFAFTGMVTCGECSAAITAEEKNQLICSVCKHKFGYENKFNCPGCDTPIAEMKNPKFLKYVYYRCTKKKNKNCTQKTIKIEDLEAQIDKELTAMKIDEDYLKLAIDYLNETKTQQFEDKATIKSNLQKLIDECDRRLKRLSDEFTSVNNLNYQIYSPEEYAELKTAVKTEKAGYQTEFKNAQDKSDEWLELSERTFNFCAYAHYHFNNGDLKTKGEILRSLGSNLILKDRKLFINAYEPFLLIKNYLSSVSSSIEWLEPENNNAVSGLDGLSQSQITSWRGHKESNPGLRFWRSPSYH